MNLQSTNGITIAREEKYATRGDFCRLFAEEMSSLYRLSFLLTGDDVQAEQCFVAALEDSLNGNQVFKQWARSWARRMIVENAIRIITPRANRALGTAVAVHLELNGETGTVPNREESMEHVLALADFERFVFVMSVLERYSDQDCSVLLGYRVREIRDARTRALQQIGELSAMNPAADCTAAAS